MKLHFVKFLTSRENEIEKKEEGGRRLKFQCLFSPGQSAARLPLSPSFLHRSPFPPPVPPARILRHPASPPPRVRRAIFSSYPSPAVLLLSFFFIKLPKRKSVADVVPSQPVQLSYPTIACGRPARRTLAPPGGLLVLHRFRFLLSLGAVHPHRAKP